MYQHSSPSTVANPPLLPVLPSFSPSFFCDLSSGSQSNYWRRWCCAIGRSGRAGLQSQVPCFKHLTSPGSARSHSAATRADPRYGPLTAGWSGVWLHTHTGFTNTSFTVANLPFTLSSQQYSSVHTHTHFALMSGSLRSKGIREILLCECINCLRCPTHSSEGETEEDVYQPKHTHTQIQMSHNAAFLLHRKSLTCHQEN